MLSFVFVHLEFSFVCCVVYVPVRSLIHLYLCYMEYALENTGYSLWVDAVACSPRNLWSRQTYFRTYRISGKRLSLMFWKRTFFFIWVPHARTEKRGDYREETLSGFSIIIKDFFFIKNIHLLTHLKTLKMRKMTKKPELIEFITNWAERQRYIRMRTSIVQDRLLYSQETKSIHVMSIDYSNFLHG